MKLVKIVRNGATAQGVIDGNDVRVIGGWRSEPSDSAAFDLPSRSLAAIADLAEKSTEIVALDRVTLAVPADPLRKIICAGINYRDHAGEIKSDEPAHPIFFTRSLDSLVAHGQPILRPRISETFDYEGEIAVIIGREGRHIATPDALSYVFGYSCFLDGSVREYQRHSLTVGKNFWQSGSMGPWIVTADAVHSSDLFLETRLNGQVVQSSKQSLMIFGITELISYCSRWTWLRAGDVIATGTPGGVGSRRTPPLWMKSGDQIEVEVEGVGCLTNPVAAET
jgi:2-keto-4-pentenoate hydratase/2-oxohepta-3-ene-1,7-dioic acid hydratase in catechol pathway